MAFFYAMLLFFFTQWKRPIEKKTINLHKTKCLLILNYKYKPFKQDHNTKQQADVASRHNYYAEHIYRQLQH